MAVGNGDGVYGIPYVVEVGLGRLDYILNTVGINTMESSRVYLAALGIGMAVTRMITRPIAALTEVINDISELDMQSGVVIPATHDEVGTMGNAVIHMKEQLVGIVSELNDISENLEHKVMNDYDEFMQSSDEYSGATRSIEEFMNQANEEVILIWQFSYGV